MCGSMVDIQSATAEIGPVVWGTPANFSGFRVLAVLLYGTVVVGVSQTLQRWTEGATYIRQGGHHVGQLPKFLDVHNFLPGVWKQPNCKGNSGLWFTNRWLISPVPVQHVTPVRQKIWRRVNAIQTVYHVGNPASNKLLKTKSDVKQNY